MTDHHQKTVGVVGGVGPFAGIDLLGKIARETLAQRDQDHLTVLSISQPADVADRTEFLLGNVADNPGYALAAQVLKLAQMGAEVVGIPCNTAHAPPIFDVLVGELQTHGSPAQLLHMIGEVAHYLRAHHPALARVGVLSTTGTYKTRVYPKVLETQGFEVLLPELGIQEAMIHRAIVDPEYGIKAQGRATERARADLIAGIHHLQRAGAEAVILGCTELPLAFDEEFIDGVTLIDPTRILARALIREANPAKLRQPVSGM